MKRIGHPGWWIPVLGKAEDWAGKLMTRLAKGLRKKWDERSPLTSTRRGR